MRKFQTGIKCSLVAEVENLIMLLACRNCVVEKVLKDHLQNQIMHWRGGETIKEDSLDEGVNEKGCGGLRSGNGCGRRSGSHAIFASAPVP